MKNKHLGTAVCLAFCFLINYTLLSQDHHLDSNTGTLIHYNDVTDFVDWESPVTSNGISFYNSGIQGQAANFYGSSLLTFNASDNFEDSQGTFEAWVRPNWSAGDGVTRALLSKGGGGGIIIEKDGGSYLKIIVNRYGADSAGNEVSVGVNVSSWSPGIWYHIACTWSSSSVKLYIDGDLVNSATMSYTPPSINSNIFHIGSDNGNSKWEGQIDELRISKFARTAAEIQATYDAFDSGNIHDNKSTLLLRFNNSTQGEIQEDAYNSQFVSYGNGVLDRAAFFNGNEDEQYIATGNINSSMGTFEGWVKPNFEPAPGGGSHTILSWGGGGGILIFINGGSTLRLIVNRYAIGGNPEININYDISDWSINEWHHIAVTWSSSKLEMYLDGSKVSESETNFDLHNIPDQQFYIGSDSGNLEWLGFFDEFRISNTVRTSSEIETSFFNGLDVTELTLKENDLEVYPVWRYKPEVCVTSGGQSYDISPALLDWGSSNNYVATVDNEGVVHFHNPSNVSLFGVLDGFDVQLNCIIKDALIDPEYPDIDPEMSTPASCSKAQMKVVIINYFPTLDGENLDVVETGPDLGGGPYPLTNIASLVNDNSIMMKHMSEERTKFRGYSNPEADPYLGYEVIEYINVYEPLPRFLKVPFQGNAENGTINYIDMPKIAERFDWQNYVDNLDVDEIWVWGYHNDQPNGIFGSESEMSSPTTIDISNSHNFVPESELPVYSKTYTVYGFNYGRTPNLHNQGHQLEALFKFVDEEMFLENFVGQVGNVPPLGRAGDTHRPPNTTVDYDYLNPTLVSSDIEAWEPNGGPTTLVNVDTWAALDYNWPYGLVPPAITEVNYYIYWMQSMPGYLNTIPYNDKFMTNWWEFVADWDNAILNNQGLFGDSPSPISPDDDCLDESCMEFSFNSFESGLESWIDGGSDCARVASNANTGNYSIRIRDNSGSSSSISSPISNWSAADGLKVEFSYYPVSMENNEDFFLEVSTNGGASYTLVKSWKRGTDFNNYTRYDEIVEINDISFTSNSRIRFRCDASSNADLIYLDDIKISTCNEGEVSDCSDFNSEGFEINMGIWNDGGSDCVRTTTNPGSGNYSLRLRDNSSSSHMITDAINLSGYSGVEIDFHYYPNSMEINEDFFIEMSVDGGASYTQQFNFVRGTDFENNTHYDDSVSFTPPFSNATKFRIRCDASSNADRVYFDDVLIKVCGVDDVIQDETILNRSTSQKELSIFPNPIKVGDILQIRLDESAEIHRIELVDENGKTIKSLKDKSFGSSTEMSLSSVTSGTYFVRFISDFEIKTEKLIIVE